MIITIHSPSAVFVDGNNFGQVCDAIANNPKIASDVQRALVAYDAAMKASAKEALDSANKTASDLQAKLDAKEANQQRLVTAAVEALAKVKAGASLEYIEAVVADASRNETERKRAAAQAEFDRAQAALVALG